MGVACVIAVCEFVWKSRKVAVDERVSCSNGGSTNGSGIGVVGGGGSSTISGASGNHHHHHHHHHLATRMRSHESAAAAAVAAAAAAAPNKSATHSPTAASLLSADVPVPDIVL